MPQMMPAKAFVVNPARILCFSRCKLLLRKEFQFGLKRKRIVEAMVNCPERWWGVSSSFAGPVRVIRFGSFEADLHSRELRKSGIRIKLHDQPFQILTMLLERPGELVTREEIRKRLWPDETYVNFDHGLNNAVNRLREALGDSADSPRFIETLPRRGYRFNATVHEQRESPLQDTPAAPSDTSVPASSGERKRKWRRASFAWIAVAVAAILVAAFTLVKLRTSTTTRPAPIRSLAVLPMQNLSGDPTQEYLADGMTDALITHLARFGSLRVISRTSIMTYKSAKKPLSQISRELNVDAVVEGSVVRSGTRVRVNAQLIQVSPERHLWANAYERDVADIVALQGDVAKAIANEIQVQLRPRERTYLADNRLVNPDAYQAYLLGRYFADRAGKDNLDKAVSYYEHAIHIDPNYALAWAGAADAHWMLSISGHAPVEEEIRKSRAAVERAIALDPDLAEAYAALGSIQMFIDWNWTAAGASIDRALALEPGNVSAMRQAAIIAAINGRLDESIQLAHRAAERAPLDPRAQRGLGTGAFLAGQLDEALTAFNRSLQLSPEGAYVHKSLVCVYLAKSLPQDALREAEQEKVPEERLVSLVMAYHALGRKKESDTALDGLIKNYGDIAAYQVAQGYAFRGEVDGAFNWLERAYIQHDGALLALSFDPLLKSLHSDQRWGAFLRKMGMPVRQNL